MDNSNSRQAGLSSTSPDAAAGGDQAAGDGACADPLSCSGSIGSQTGGELAVEIVHEHDAWASIAGLEHVLATAARSAYRQAGSVGPAELCIALADNTIVADLNIRFRGIAKPTNVLSFPAPDWAGPPDGSAEPLGDLVLAYETVAAEAASMAIAFQDHATHLVVHGTLHLLGFDHENDTEAAEMEALEIRILAALGIADPYADQELENASAHQAGG